MPPPETALHTFFPWLKHGAPQLPAAGETRALASDLTVTVLPQGSAPVAHAFRLAGPGDVLGIDPRQVIRNEPSPGTQRFEANFLAAVEFDRPDFPWLFSPDTLNGAGQVDPWLCLVVVPEDDRVAIRPGAAGLPPLLDLQRPVAEALPDPAQAWAWAHGQAIGKVTGAGAASDMAALDSSNPERTLSRLVCPTRLAPETPYVACVVPVFQVGRMVGLGLSVADAAAASVSYAWQAGDAGAQLPIFHFWRFRTGPAGDFASLMMKLKSYEFPANAGIRAMAVGAAGQGLPVNPEATAGLESALLPPGPLPEDWDGAFVDSFRDALRVLLSPPSDPDGDPLITPPLYAGPQAGQVAPPAPGDQPVWMSDLNLDPRHRVVAGFGTRVVQAEQEPLMASAWDQAGDARRANAMRRHAQLVCRGAQAIQANHVAKLAPGALIEMNRPLFGQIAVAAGMTLRGKLADAQVPVAVTSRAFRVAARPRGPLMRTVLPPAARVMREVTTRVAARDNDLLATFQQPPFEAVTPEDVEAAWRASGSTRPAGAPGVGFLRMQGSGIDDVDKRPNFMVAPPALPGSPLIYFPVLPSDPQQDSEQGKRFRDAATRHHRMLGPAMSIFAPTIPPFHLATLQATVLAQTDPAARIAQWVGLLIKRPDEPSHDGATLDPIGIAPRFPQPMYEALRAVSQEAILPTLNDVPDNRVALLQTNPRFVEAFLAGLNTEMSRELLWRDYPADFRATFFQSFWDRRVAESGQPDVDIPPIAQWPAAKRLGTMTGSDETLLVLMIRGEITRRYPDATVYMVQADWPNGKPRPILGTEEVHPVMTGTLDPDVRFFGFTVTTVAALGTEGSRSDAGYFFVIQEHPCAPRFGVAADAQEGPLAAGPDAAATARTYLRPPVRMAMHARDLLRDRPEDPLRPL